MISLIKKDLMILRQLALSLVMLVVVWLVVGLWMKMPEFFSGLSVMFAVMLPLNTMAYDEKVGWNAYALTMPISMRDIVLSKYLLGGGASLLSSILALGIGLLSLDLMETLMLCGASFAVSIVLLDVLLPIVFRFGVEKSRIIFVFAFIIPMAGGFLLNYLKVPAPSLDIISALVRMSPVLIVLLTIGSVWLSIRLMKNKKI